jgi:hypothetical protein
LVAPVRRPRDCQNDQIRVAEVRFELTTKGL